MNCGRCSCCGAPEDVQRDDHTASNFKDWISADADHRNGATGTGWTGTATWQYLEWTYEDLDSRSDEFTDIHDELLRELEEDDNLLFEYMNHSGPETIRDVYLFIEQLDFINTIKNADNALTWSNIS